MSIGTKEGPPETLESPSMIYKAQAQVLASGDINMNLYFGTLAQIAGHMPTAEDYRGRKGIVPASGIFRVCNYILNSDSSRAFLFRPALANMHGLSVRDRLLASGDNHLLAETASSLIQVGRGQGQPTEAEVVIFGRQPAEALAVELDGRGKEGIDTAEHLAALFDYVLNPPAGSYRPFMTDPALADA